MGQKDDFAIHFTHITETLEMTPLFQAQVVEVAVDSDGNSTGK